ncbi:hypothetical protein SAY86_031792 [Trapa natans]|uniref:Uncharacterized protein n=1 Tax=Trapa natans TaxID=22666 RepID=A0AAN7LTD6_TRANT|nr:hypothetical protein SAY86_031792 [Trapa natans]
MVTCLAVCTIIELSSMWNLTRIEVKLCNMLSPEAPQLSLASYNWCLVFIAIPVDNFLYTISALRSHFSQSISWSGIPYHLKDGKISKIDRNKNIGPKFTDLGGKKLHEKKGSSTKSSFVGSLARSLVQWRQPKNIVYSMYSSPYMLSSYKEGMPLVASIAEGEIVWSTLLPLHSVQLNTPRD